MVFLWSWHWVFECRHWCFCDSRLVASVKVDSVLESQLIGPPASITTCPALTSLRGETLLKESHRAGS